MPMDLLAAHMCCCVFRWTVQSQCGICTSHRLLTHCTRTATEMHIIFYSLPTTQVRHRIVEHLCSYWHSVQGGTKSHYQLIVSKCFSKSRFGLFRQTKVSDKHRNIIAKC